MKDLDAQLIFEAYNEEVIDEGLKDIAKRVGQYGAIGAATAASALGSPPAKSAPAVEPAPISQTAQAESPTSFDGFVQQLKQDTETQTKQVMGDISKISAEMKNQQAKIDQLSKDMGDPYAELMAMELQHKMEKLKLDYQNKQHEIESIKIYKMGEDQKITIDQMEKMLDDLDKQYGFDLGELKAVFN